MDPDLNKATLRFLFRIQEITPTAAWIEEFIYDYKKIVKRSWVTEEEIENSSVLYRKAATPFSFDNILLCIISDSCFYFWIDLSRKRQGLLLQSLTEETLMTDSFACKISVDDPSFNKQALPALSQAPFPY